MNSTDMLTTATKETPAEIDTALRETSRSEALNLTQMLRLRWFYLAQVRHAELERVTKDLQELLELNNEVKIISIIGMTGIGKTTLASNLLQVMLEQYRSAATPSEIPVIYVRAPANGENSLSWTGLYRRILENGHEVMIEQKRAVSLTNGELQVRKGGRVSLTNLRAFIESMFKHRNVRVLVIDEAMHLLRFDAYAAIMDTLKSLADIHDTKLLLIGSYDFAKLMTEYGQVAKRSEIIHYRRYVVGEIKVDAPTKDQAQFRDQVAKFQTLWPCKDVPNLMAIWPNLMNASLGSIGLLKASLLRLLSLQLSNKNEKITVAMLKKFTKAPNSLTKIERETIAGEQELQGACYGDSTLGTDAEIKALFERIQEPINV